MNTAPCIDGIEGMSERKYSEISTLKNYKLENGRYKTGGTYFLNLIK